MTSNILPRALNTPTTQRITLGAMLIVALAIAALPRVTSAADAPVVRQVEAAPAPAATAPQTTRASEPAPIAVGDITRALLAAQADGRRAGTELGIPGPVASASWKRYVDSFAYPQPEFFEERLEKSSSN